MLFNSLFDSNLLYYGIFTGTALFLGYAFYNYTWYNSGSNSAIDNINTDIISAFDDTETTSSDESVTLMPNIYEEKLQEIIELYGEEINNNQVNMNDLVDVINDFQVDELYSSDINEFILTIINYL